MTDETSVTKVENMWKRASFVRAARVMQIVLSCGSSDHESR
jgi:hypothetical protein